MAKLTIRTSTDLIDLYPSTPFQLTLNGISVGDLTGRSISYTNSIKIPKSKRNLALPRYTKIAIDIYDGSIKLRSCFAYVNEVSDTIMLSIAVDELDVFEQWKEININSPEFFTYKGSGLNGLINNASNYAKRLGGTPVVGIVINHGKLNRPPIPSILNGSFTLGADGFENWDAEAGWTVVAGSAQYSIAAGGVTTLLKNNSVTIYAGYQYTFSFNINIGASVNTFFVLKIGNTLYLNNLLVAGAHAFNISVIKQEKVTGIEIYMYRVGGGGAVVHSIQDVAVAIDQRAYIQCDSENEFYLPSFTWLDLLPTFDYTLRTNVLGDIVNTRLTDITDEQQAFLDSIYFASVKSELAYDDSFIDLHRVKAELNVGQVIVVTGNTNVKWPIHTEINIGNWDVNDEIYTNTGILYTPNATVNVTLQISVTAFVGAPGFVVEVMNTGVSVYVSQVFNTTGIKNISFTTYASLGTVTVRIRRTAGTSASMTIVVGTLNIDMVKEPSWITGSHAYNGLLLPKMTMHDVIKDFITRTCAVVRTKYDPSNGKTTLQLQFVENIINNKSGAVNWTTKRKKNKTKPITFEYGSFAATNYFQDSGSSINMVSRMILDILNENIVATKDYYTSPLDTIVDEAVKTIQLANLKAADKETDSDPTLESDLETIFNSTNSFLTMKGFDEKAALIKARRELSTDPEVRFGTNIAATYLIGTYCKPSEFKPLFWSGMQQALYKPEVSVDEYDLTPSDINNFDEWQLIYDDNAYYLLIALKYSPNQSSVVTKFRVY